MQLARNSFTHMLKNHSLFFLIVLKAGGNLSSWHILSILHGEQFILTKMETE